MVARPDSSGDEAPTVATRAAALFLWWRRALTAVFLWCRRALVAVFVAWRRLLSVIAARTGRALPRLGVSLRRVAAFPPLSIRFALRPSASLEEDERRQLAVAGALSLAAGTGLSLALAPALHVPAAETAIAAVWVLGWAGLRLGILRMAARRTPASAVRLAWAAGLLPAVVGVTGILRVLALGASAWLTLGALLASGTEVGDARTAVGWAFGAEVVAALARWIASALLLAAIAAR